MIESLQVPDLRWRCAPESLPFETTAEVKPATGVAGQESAVEALRFGIESSAPGQNVYVRGLTGTGRMSLVRRLLDELKPACRLREEHVYVHDFAAPDRPRLLTLPPGQGRRLRKLVRGMAEFVRSELAEHLTGESVNKRRTEIESETRQQLEALTAPFEEELKAAGLTMVHQKVGNAMQTSLAPLHEGRPMGGEELNQLRAAGTVTDEDFERWSKSADSFSERLKQVTRAVQKIRAENAQKVGDAIAETARDHLGGHVDRIVEEFGGEDVAKFLNELVDDVIEHLGSPARGGDPTQLYDVNVLLEREESVSCPIVVETAPTLSNLLGTVEPGWSEQGPTPSDFRHVRAGSVLRANGGYLVLEARDVLTQPNAWRVLVRSLRTGQLEIVPEERSSPFARSTVKPQPIPVSLRVILVGDAGVYYALDSGDPDFGHLFKVLADFEHELQRDGQGLEHYAGVLARLVEEEQLPHFDRTAVAALAEHGARVAARAGKLTARFARIADIAREAAYLAAKRGSKETVKAEDIHETVRRTKSRADLPSRRFQSMIANRTIVIETTKPVVGQVNGLAVIKAGMLSYGFPARITATIAPGRGGIIDIEGSASLSGQIHTKGFHILGGLLRHLLRTDHPLAFSASLAFEQSYGGIDGDSASGAEICCLLSALTGIPLRQDVAMTGAIDQHGRIQAIGGVNEKIEGFFDACISLGFTGAGGVIIPHSNAGDLMLRQDVVEACAEGRFHVWAVESVHQALEIFTGRPAGEPDTGGIYPEGTLLHTAKQRALEFWKRTLVSPDSYGAAPGIDLA